MQNLVQSMGMLLAGLFLFGQPLAAQQPETQEPAQVMLLGSFHLANNNRDLINLPIEDVLAPHRQAELAQLVENLARWKPTRIVLEWDRSNQNSLDQRYQQYLNGELELTANERDQIGMRLAKRLGHKKVYAVDWAEGAPGDQSDYDFLTWANENGEADRLTAFIENAQSELHRRAETMRNQSIMDWYHDLNDPEMAAANHRQYFEIATFGDNTANPGAAWVGGWYARNLRIFNNISDLIEPGERVLVLYGSGHIYHLDRFFRETEAAELIDPRRYLRK